MKRFLSLTFILILSLASFSCSPKISGSGGKVTLSVYTHEQAIAENVSSTVEAGATAFDVFAATMREMNIPFTVNGSGANVYIKSVNGIKEFDYGATSGWVYTVNGETLSESCGSYQVNENDIITFKYITEYEENI